MKRRLITFASAMVMLFLAVAVTAQDTVQITFWSNEFQPARVERQQAIIDRFEEANPGIEVELVVMDENLMDQLMTLNVAAGTPPDVVLHPLQLTATWYNQGLLDAEFATQIINDLGADTFSQGALDLLSVEDGVYAAIPSDGWGQLLLYRTDLFEAAGLDAPTSYDSMLAAAEALHNPDNGFAGFLGASSASELYTWQVFEHIALANGASFVDADGNIFFDSPEFIEALEFYNEIMTNYGPLESDYYWLQTRAEYFAGNGAMVIWSPFILDEMAGLRDSNLPNCAECEENTSYIAENTGVVSAISGFSNDAPAAWGSVNSMGIAPDANEAAQTFVEFWMSEAYLDGLGIAAEGKFPMRQGTVDNPSEFIEGWGNLEVGVDRRAPLSDFYDAETLDIIVNGSQGYSRMGYDVGQALVASAVSTQFFIQEALVGMLNGDLTPEEAAIEMQAAAEDLVADLSE